MSTQTTHVIAPRPPLRAFLAAAALVFAGAVLVTVAAANHAALGWLELAAVPAGVGLGLAVAGASSMRRMRTFVVTDADGYRITGPGTDKHGTWDEVTRLATSADGAHVTLYHGEVGRTHILSPAGGEQMTSLVADMSRRLDDSRGYGETMNVPLIDPHNPDPDVVR